MLIVGIIKYVEKTWSLYCGSIQHLRDSFLRTIDTSKKIEQQQESKNDMNFWEFLADSIHKDFENKERRAGDPRNYLRAIYIFQRQMLPVGVGLITLRDTVIEAKRVFGDINVVPQEDNLGEACRKLLERSTTIPRNEDLRMQSTSILLHACDITNELIADAGEYRLRMWEFLEKLWVQIISKIF
ncbi:hypothetical protein RJT34_12722 [Clitoria ternatea]|uniref:DUF4220 domain-containing protein n=1 Tax=Clitoria ternatea TaxID=43366 RepID=A0AAN9JPG1_CLITE